MQKDGCLRKRWWGNLRNWVVLPASKIKENASLIMAHVVGTHLAPSKPWSQSKTDAQTAESF
ncbi:hypothetical protein RISK_000390 [Rhodopirellula islandica]|uniref:Uncharacterized protein n=1 Tax=Rhodopirellula islandica TaxID=595434 RepID=A0A0J1BLC4_RHOIS|nr:hypothetical protein RISK_000390 [Rhodopirellula islandica]